MRSEEVERVGREQSDGGEGDADAAERERAGAERPMPVMITAEASTIAIWNEAEATS